MTNAQKLRLECLQIASRHGAPDLTGIETVTRARAFYAFLVRQVADHKVVEVLKKKKAK